MTARNELPVQVTTPHTWRLSWHEWVWLGRTERRDSLGRRHRHGSSRWLVLRCNNPACPAEAVLQPELVVQRHARGLLRWS